MNTPEVYHLDPQSPRKKKAMAVAAMKRTDRLGDDYINPVSL